jgi:beta-glucanase (GH16 family)
MGRKVPWLIASCQRAVPASCRVVITVAALVLVAAVLAAISLVIRGSEANKDTSPREPAGNSVSAYARVPAGWTAVFSDRFSGPAGSRVDPKWVYDIGAHYNGSGCPANWGTGEVETATRSTANVSEDGHGHLLIKPVKSGVRWTSGRIETAASIFAAPTGGQMEVIASVKQPSPSNGLGYWPAFWMLGGEFRASGAGMSGTMACPKWPSVGEIDILEDGNALSRHSGTFHCGIDPGGPCRESSGLTSGPQPCPGCQAGYNTYSVIVNRTRASEESITWYLNGKAYYAVTERQVGVRTWKTAVDHGFFLILDLAIGGGYPDGVCGCTTPAASTSSGAAMGVGYVAVYLHRP